MATYTVAAGERGVRGKTLVADAADTVTFERNIGAVEILVVTADGDENDIWFTTDGSTAEVDGVNSQRLIGLRGASVQVDMDQGEVVSLVSAGTPTYDVSWVR